MGIRLETADREIGRAIEAEIRKMDAEIRRVLSYAGELAVAHARSLPSPDVTGLRKSEIKPHQPHYIDWTANLRSSIGYVLAVRGRVTDRGGFSAQGGGTEGARLGLRTAKRAARAFPTGYALIVTAGMEYASYVTDKGYDVIESAEHVARQLVEELFGRL